MKRQLLAIPILLITVNISYGYTFLGLFPVPIKSHFVMFEKLMKTLAERGHHVDVLSHYPQLKPTIGYTDINVANSLPRIENNISIEEAIHKGPIQNAGYMLEAYGVEICEKVFKHPQTKLLKSKKKKYDAIIVEVLGTDCFLGFAHLYQIPIIGISSTMYLPWGGDRIGNPDNPAYIPNYFLPQKGRLTLLEKMEVSAAAVIAKLGYYLYSTIPSEMRARDFFGTDLPPLDNLAFNTSLLLVNTHFTMNVPMPNVPNFIEVGGMHIEKPKTLPQNLSKIISSAPNGIIYFSMGTVIRMETFPKNKLKALIEAFAKLPQTVIWQIQTEDFPEAVPKNIVLVDWVPQLDVLCHPNVRLFITHGGQMSTQEARYCGVPILGIPIFADHNLNVVNFESQGAGVKLDYGAISTEGVLKLINNVLKNNSYTSNAQRLSKLFNDRPISALDTAIYWVEYVVRHGGAKHLRTRGADLIWFEYYLVDVVLVFLVLFILIGMAFFFLINRLQNYFDNQSIQVPTKKKEN